LSSKKVKKKINKKVKKVKKGKNMFMDDKLGKIDV